MCITGWRDASIHHSALPRPDDPGGDRGDGPADVFALGAVMFEAATLVLPEPVQKFPGVPAAVHQLAARRTVLTSVAVGLQ